MYVIDASAKQILALGHLKQVELPINDRNTKRQDRRAVAGAVPSLAAPIPSFTSPKPVQETNQVPAKHRTLSCPPPASAVRVCVAKEAGPEEKAWQSWCLSMCMRRVS